MTISAAPQTKPGLKVVPTVLKTTRRESEARKTAEPVKFILDRETKDVVGWLYRWNTGALVPMWKNGVCKNVIYE